MAKLKRIEAKLPYNWWPRDYQMPLLRYLEDGGKRAVAVWHRRSGKDLTAINFVGVESQRRVGVYYHLLPTYNQGTKVIWDGKDNAGRAFLDYFHPATVSDTFKSELQVKFKNGSIYQVVGADTYDRLVGPNPVGLILSEYAISNAYPKAWDYLRPILAANKGWAIFLYTPRGRNHGFDLYQMAKHNPGWFAELLTVDDTQAIDPDVIIEEQRAGMSDEMIQQEFFCSWTAPQYGAYWGKYMTDLRLDGRICGVPHQPGHEVHTAWDLGIGDATAIWFFQSIHRQIHMIDYYEMDGLGLEDYVRVLDERGKECGYKYGEHFAPHDIEARELGTGLKRIDLAKQLGIRFRVMKRLANKMHGIDLVRNMLPICWFDEIKCARGIDCLESYRKEWVDRLNTWRDKPLHDEFSHGADSFVVLCQAYTKMGGMPQPAKRIDRYDVKGEVEIRPLAM